MSEKEKIEGCKLLKEGYEKYKNDYINKIDRNYPTLRSDLDMEHFLSTTFGMVKFGAEYYSVCNEDWDKIHLLNKIAEKAIKINDIVKQVENVQRIQNIIKVVQKGAGTIESLEKQFNTHKKAIKTNYNKL